MCAQVDVPMGRPGTDPWCVRSLWLGWWCEEKHGAAVPEWSSFHDDTCEQEREKGKLF